MLCPQYPQKRGHENTIRKKMGVFLHIKIGQTDFGQQIRSFGQTLTSKSVNFLVNYTI